MPPTPEALLAALRARGVTPQGETPVRDAVHEAAHAIAWEVPAPWTRERISENAPEDPALKFEAECLARAVEGLVCRAVGVDPGKLERRALTAAMEALKIDGYRTSGLDPWIGTILDFEESSKARALADAILALTTEVTS